ncbi:MAG: hypothetical protein J7K84_07525 [Deltaproteobacteria bacterium]|nr:hypothetical protein [Deltaproteobacteria bacterium]
MRGLKQEHAVVYGTYSLHIPDISRPFEYGIVLLIPNNYPKAAPRMFCNDSKLPLENIDRHIMPYGMACLGVQAEIGMYWQPDSTIADFLNNLVAPFLAWQTYFNEYGEPPLSWGERSHFSKGILEFYAELLGRSADSTIVGFMRLLARKNQPKGHESCPCDSGMRLRSYRRNLLYKILQRVIWKDVEHDLAIIDEFVKSQNGVIPAKE